MNRYQRGDQRIRCNLTPNCRCELCWEYMPTPRPDTWGDKLQSKLESRAVKYHQSMTGRSWWGVDVLIEYLERDFPKASKGRVRKVAERVVSQE